LSIESPGARGGLPAVIYQERRPELCRLLLIAENIERSAKHSWFVIPANSLAFDSRTILQRVLILWIFRSRGGYPGQDEKGAPEMLLVEFWGTLG
jgi:hypothetical protein